MCYANRKGEEFVEAAIVLPLMILTRLSLIITAVFLYSYNLSQAEAHVQLMNEVVRSRKVFDVKRKSVSTSERIRGLYRSDIQKNGSFRAYVIDQADAVRTGSLVGSKDAE